MDFSDCFTKENKFRETKKVEFGETKAPQLAVMIEPQSRGGKNDDSYFVCLLGSRLL